MAESYQGIQLFGCSIRSINAQFGLNQNPSIVTAQVVRDVAAGQVFQLVNGTTRTLVDISVGALNLRGIVQSVEEDQINISGSGVFTVKVTDTKPVLEATQIFLNALSNDLNLGENIISISPEYDSDFEEGIRFEYARQRIHGKTMKYGDNIFTVDLSRIVLPSRGIDIEYRVKGSSLSLIEFIQQVMIDHAMDWYIETSTSNVITVIPIKRSVQGINIDFLKTGGNVIRQTKGFENRDDVNRSVLLGAQKQILSFIDGPRFSQFWGFDVNGVPLTQPTFSIVYQNGQKLTKIVTVDEIRRVLNKEIGEEDVGADYLNALQQYGNENWGRKFWFKITPAQIDSRNNPWIDVISAGFWEAADGNPRPDGMPKDGALKFGTDDGRYSAFAKLPEPAERIIDRLKIKWDDSVRLSQSVLITETGQWYMKCSAERFGVYIVVTLATPLVVTQNDTASSTTEQDTLGRNRRSALAKAYIPTLDKRRHYGPWSFEPVNKSGKTELVIDTSLNPWNFGYRDILLPEALAIQNRVALARLRAISVVNTEIDTAELEITGLPLVNIGTTVGKGTNITSININFGVGGIITTYRANIFTSELTRLNRIYQDIVDSLRRKTRLITDNYFGPVNYPALTQEGTPDKNNDNPPSADPSNNTDSFAAGLLCRVLERDVFSFSLGLPQPFYKLQRVRETIVNGGITYEELDIRFLANVRNKSEPDDKPGRVTPGTIVTAFRSISSNNAYYFELSTQPPSLSNGKIVRRVGNRRYEVELLVPDGRLTPSEVNLLLDVENIGEPINSPGRLAPDTVIDINWVENIDGTLVPRLNVPVHIFGNPGE